MKRINKLTFSLVAIAIVIGGSGIVAYRYDQPLKIEPGTDWEATIARLDITLEHFFIQSGDVELEAAMLIPDGGREVKPAVIFAGGSGSWIYQTYAEGFVEEFVLRVFLPRDVSVLLINKRGLGVSSGNWMHNDLQGRADDVYAAVEHLQNHPSIDPAHIGLIGHSQGGWVVTLVAAQHEELAFTISLAGPTTTVSEQIEADARNYLRCKGYEGQALVSELERDLRMDRIGAVIGEIIPVGEIGFMAGIIDFDPWEAFQSVTVPGLLIYGGLDPQVPPDVNLARLDEIFGGSPPEYLQTVVIPEAQHLFRIVDSECMMYEDFLSGPLSDELVVVLQNWLTEQGFAAWQIMEALWVSKEYALNRFVSEQAPYNLLDRRIERELLPMTRSYGIGVLTWSPLAGGFLAGKYRRGEQVPSGSRFEKFWKGWWQKHLTDVAFDIAEGIERQSEVKGCTPGQLALAWYLRQPGITSVIIGPRTIEHLEENLGALEVSLTEKDVEEIEALAPPGLVAVPYYKEEGWERHLFRW
jgi:pimeloyl-ACP methyl ester carboxylesterase